MKRFMALILLFTALAVQAKDPIGFAVETYFTGLFAKLETVAAQKPTHDTLREAMKPLADAVDGFFGGTLITPDFVINQSYYKTHALANGYDLKKVKELDYFWDLMRTAPAPQLSEPAHGNLFQPRLIALRCPILKDGCLQGLVSVMIRTENFLKATGLAKCHAYKIICRGQLAEEKGELSNTPHEVRLQLPATEWIVQYDL
jgi:hypothetical protein